MISMLCYAVLMRVFFFFFFKQKTAYEMRISDWSSDVCSSDLLFVEQCGCQRIGDLVFHDLWRLAGIIGVDDDLCVGEVRNCIERNLADGHDAGSGQKSTGKQNKKAIACRPTDQGGDHFVTSTFPLPRSEEHTSELQSLMRISYAVFCLKTTQTTEQQH